MQPGTGSAFSSKLCTLAALSYEMYTLVLGTCTVITHAGNTHHTIHQARSATDSASLHRLVFASVSKHCQFEWV